MVEIWTAPFTAVTNTVISSSDFNAGVRGNLLWLRQFLSANPSTTGQLVVSSGANSAGWVTPVDTTLMTTLKVQAATTIAGSFAALIAASKNGFHEVSGTDGPVSGQTYYCYNVTEQNTPTGYAAQIAINILDQNEVYLRVIIGGTPGAWVKLWHAGNDGGSSTLDAGLFNGQLPAFYATAASVAALNTVPSGLGGFFATAAGIAAGWTRYTNADGRLLVGAGTTFSQTFTENTAVGANWTPFAGAAVSTGVAADQTLFDTTPAVTAASAPSHTHLVTLAAQTWAPVARAVVWATKN